MNEQCIPYGRCQYSKAFHRSWAIHLPDRVSGFLPLKRTEERTGVMGVRKGGFDRIEGDGVSVEFHSEIGSRGNSEHAGSTD